MAKILIKPGVQFTTIAPAGVRILETLRAIAANFPHDITITSACDGEHSGPDDPHHTGEALDIRTHGLPKQAVSILVASLQARLGARFYAFHEAPGTDHAHVHVQRSKGTVYTIEDYLGGA